MMKSLATEFVWPAMVFLLAAAPAAYREQRSFTIPVQEKTIDIGSGPKDDAWQITLLR
jgi:hypothetical protein